MARYFFLLGWIILRKITATRWTTEFTKICIFFILFLLPTSSLFFQCFSYPLKQMVPIGRKAKVDAIVVAGAGVDPSGVPTLASTIRAYAAGRLYQGEWAPLIIVSGGITKPNQPSEAKDMTLILRGMGIPDQNILIEDRSVDSFQNGHFTAKILKHYGFHRILLVSQDYHLPRLIRVFEKQGVTVYPYAASSMASTYKTTWWEFFSWENINRVKTITHEYLGLFYYKATGRI